MVKRLYWIHVNSKNLEETDPNIDVMFSDIKWGLTERKKDFEFEIRILINGFMESDQIARAINLFVNDLVREDGSIHGIFTWEQYAECLNNFIKNYFKVPYKKWDYENEYYLGAFYNGNRSGKVIKFYLPKDKLSEKKYEELLALGPDSLLSLISPQDAVEFFVPYLYFRLGEKLDENPALANIRNYQAGLA